MGLVFCRKGHRFGDVDDLMAFGLWVVGLSVGRQGRVAVLAHLGHIGVRFANAVGRQQRFGVWRMSRLPAGFAAGGRLGRRLGLLLIAWPGRLLLGQVVEAVLHPRSFCL